MCLKKCFAIVILIASYFHSAAVASDVNIAVVATPTSSHVSGDTSLGALNDGHSPDSSHVRGQGSYGNWPSRGTQWVQYEWSQPISTKKVDVFWWDDHQGVRLPKECRLLYWDGENFVPVKKASGLGVAASQFNTTTFEEVDTSELRLEIDGDGNFSTGILEWRVYDSGKSPAFPPTVDAGIDRTVVLGGKSFLEAKLKTLGTTDDRQTKVTWTKASGPGEVNFANPASLVTTATFSTLGDYVLEMTATQGPLLASSTLAVKVVAPPPKQQLELIDTKHYTIDSPLWNHRAKALIVNWIPHCIRKISDPELREGGINNFVDAGNKLAGKPFQKHRGHVFSNAWIYNTIESICIAQMVDPQGDAEIIEAQQSMRATMDDWIPKILAAQEPDGYIQTFFTLGDYPRWSPRHRADHEGYVAGYFLEAAISHYLLTEKTDARLYDAAKKLADCWCDHLGPAPKKPWYDGHQAMEIALVRFGRFVNRIEGAGKGDDYIELAKFLLDNRKDGDEYDQSHVPVTQQYEAVGHAVRASYSYAGMADVAMETGDVDYQSAVMSLWDNMVNRKYYVTGGLGSGETSEGFGPDYSLRHNAYCESCSSCGEIFFQHKLHLPYHQAKYVDLYEETLYNALLGSIDLEGKNFYYQNPLDINQLRYDWHGCPCCVGNIPRTLLMLPTWMYSKSADSIYVNLFVGSTVSVGDVADTDVQMIQQTDYPWSGDVSITVNPTEQREFSVRIRVPDHCVSELYTSEPQSDGITSIAVNGSVGTPQLENGYAVITRVWNPGDKIDLVLPMKIQRIRGIDNIEATRGQVALRRGPLIYCVESVDQELGKSLDRKATLTSDWQADLLDGVTLIRGAWADGTRFTAIPYYARQNRAAKSSNGRSTTRSSVWIRETDSPK
ncbi:Non-reducing end beta-L-arabinofuranosidase [Planctomycetes bacterium CA13]|uniref:Non-reducing end beta-L-arabinofuranosidase n=1 Tax=Novipirellula herctigrandis TaxID=2527986 RepID=A0A5C5Z6X4_9BACT|nr:Non-reducing end beta-L-arabinofuranosidase [Planctomycetes bacterium CA13]